MKRLALILSLLALGASGLVACGGDDEESDSDSAAQATTTTGGEAGGGGGGTIAFEADPDGALAYTETSISAPAGADTIEFNNPASIGHDVVIEDADGTELARTDVITDDTATTTAQLEPGEFTYYCSVDAHRDAGMEGKLTVE